MEALAATMDSHVLNATALPRLLPEEKEDLKIAEKRRFELERRARIFDAKRRTIGVDKSVLDQQVEEKKAQKKQQYIDDHRDDRTMVAIDKQLKLLDLEKNRVKRAAEQECKEFSLKYLNFESRADYDLNDPLAKRKSLPARVGDDDPRCGPASMQQFNGEDLMKDQRFRQQCKEQADFIEQQKFEKAMIKKLHEHDDDTFVQESTQMTNARNLLEEKEYGLRKELVKAQQNYNLEKGMANSRAKAKGAELDSELNAKELAFHASDPFLNETGPHHVPCGRIRRDAYKGTSRMERSEVAQLQLQQHADDMTRRRDAKHEDNAYAFQSEYTRKQLIHLEREKQRQKRERMMANAQENMQIMTDQKKRAADMTAHLTSAPDDAYWAMWGTSCR
eukprot:gnl/TRDRNA2_/TRDRNA2_187906_c0_seq1.p1 gnl/TRDRNA2_/TRDRNA2_187906_c0~~gnl/TRDRNA2_/TRDRNA2_187906_c0_seq1.p1  ORF type:complete len:437 (-),score=107.65 gnl/TRDRNA2_/TRDRNA2_187906_c0_seq1:254-1426(-)